MVTSRRVRLSSKGQLVIPQEMRETLGLRTGDELILHLLDERLLLFEIPEPSPFEQATERLRRHAQERGITREDVERAVHEVREEMYRERRKRRSPK
ncbi:MAG: AbrB/MazE/SpoVT family DNA-binding domain-containing protein [Armatimonadetes bacterium]|nr:AbrB/MazE/SpoVT family DNA-binding domain-containing protein [Armatimonadota bacterium]